MAKTRAQRKAEQRRRQQQQQEARAGADLGQEGRAQHDTQVGETADVIEAELAERGADLDSLTGKADSKAPAPSRADVGVPAEESEIESEGSDQITRRAQRRAEKERKQRAKDSADRRAPKAPVAAEKRQRGGVIGFFISCWAELKRVQWPDRETLIQASMITLVFITVMAAYLGVLDAVFNWVVQRIL